MRNETLRFPVVTILILLFWFVLGANHQTFRYVVTSPSHETQFLRLDHSRSKIFFYIIRTATSKLALTNVLIQPFGSTTYKFVCKPNKHDNLFSSQKIWPIHRLVHFKTKKKCYHKDERKHLNMFKQESFKRYFKCKHSKNWRPIDKVIEACHLQHICRK